MESITPSSTRCIGVTGGIGSGKSAVCGILGPMGARIFSADAVAKQIMTNDQEAISAIIEAFGDESYTSDGSLNRGYLASRIFNDPTALATMNGIVHPRVFRAFQQEKEQAIAESIPVLVHEAALLFDTGGYKHVDDVVVVHASLDTRIERVMQRDQVSREQVLARISNQMPAEEMVERADYVIPNDGSLDQLKKQVIAFFEAYLQKHSA